MTSVEKIVRIVPGFIAAIFYVYLLVASVMTHDTSVLWVAYAGMLVGSLPLVVKRTDISAKVAGWLYLRMVSMFGCLYAFEYAIIEKSLDATGIAVVLLLVTIAIVSISEYVWKKEIDNAKH